MHLDLLGSVSVSVLFVFRYGIKVTKSLIMLLYPHRLPDRALPNSIFKQRESLGGRLARKRYYGPDGKPVKDRDYTNHGNPNVTNPHDNPFDETENGGWGHTGEYVPVDPATDDPNEGTDYNPESGWTIASKIGGGALIVGGIVLGVYTIINDITIVGVVDDVPGLIAAGEAISSGWLIIFGG